MASFAKPRKRNGTRPIRQITSDHTPRKSKNVGQEESYRARPISPARTAAIPQKMLAAGPPAVRKIKRCLTRRTLSKDISAKPQNNLGRTSNFHFPKPLLNLKVSLLTPLN